MKNERKLPARKYRKEKEKLSLSQLWFQKLKLYSLALKS
jgi:hypothetical protein